MNAKQIIQDLALALEAEADKGFDLWTWMPSFAHAYKAFGETAGNHQPTTEDLLTEACLIFSAVKNGELHPEDAAVWFSIEEAREKLGDGGWKLNDLQEFFLKQYGACIAFRRDLHLVDG